MRRRKTLSAPEQRQGLNGCYAPAKLTQKRVLFLLVGRDICVVL